MKQKPVLLVTGAPSRPGRRVVELPLERKTTMQNILLIESSPRGAQAYSHQAALSVVNELQARLPGAKVVVRDLGENPPPHVGPAFVSALQARPEVLEPEQVKALAYSDALINEVLEADVVVLMDK
jgi:FMN-dependent NADH-azoreductase